MNEIWANRLVAGTKRWAQVPSMRKAAIKAVLAGRVAEGEISPEQYAAITGDTYPAE